MRCKIAKQRRTVHPFQRKTELSGRHRVASDGRGPVHRDGTSRTTANVLVTLQVPDVRVVQHERGSRAVASAALDCNQLNALSLLVIERDGGSIESVGGAHFDAVHELHHSACSPSEVKGGGSTGSSSSALHHEVVWRVLHGLR